MNWRFVSIQTCLLAHQQEISVSGGSDGIRDLGLLESALERPKQLAYYKEDSSIAQLAASICFGIVKNHPFVDGNKRTGFIVSVLLLNKNNYSFNCPNEEVVRTIESLAASQVTEEELTVWFESHLTRIS
jgi:death-on-curing protein